MSANRLGNKNFLLKVSSSTRKLILKSEETLNLNKFLIGFLVTDSAEKNTVVPYSAELFGGDSLKSLAKIADLKQI